MQKPGNAFTLIELSIVLVIIGLIVGGVLVGKDLISAASIRSQISQIESFKTAANTFRLKYNVLPGDLGAQPCNQFGFAYCGSRGASGRGDQNGLLQGYQTTTTSTSGAFQGAEPLWFWMDLSQSQLINGTYNSYNIGSSTLPTTPDLFWPAAAVKNGNYVAVWSGGWSNADGNHYFSILQLDVTKNIGN